MNNTEHVEQSIVGIQQELHSIRNRKSMRILRNVLKIIFWIVVIEETCPEAVEELLQATKEGFDAVFKYIGGKIWDGFIERGRVTDEPLEGTRKAREYMNDIIERGNVTDQPLGGNKAVEQWIHDFIQRGKK